MVLCKFFLQGSCKYGNRCWNEHSQNQQRYQGGGGYDRNNYNNSQQNWNNTNQNYNRYGALSQQQDDRSNAARGKPAAVKDLTIEQTIEQIAAEVSAWETSNMWPFSSFACGKESPCLPGFEDWSMEEIRLQAYEAQKQGTTAAYAQKFKDLINEYHKMRQMLKRPTIEMKQKLMQTILSQQMVGSLDSTNSASAANLFGSSTTTGSGGFGSTPSVFGGTVEASSLGGGTANTGLFGKPAQTGLFGKPAQTGLFGKPAATTQSIFGGQSSVGFAAQPSGPSAFGSPVNQSQTAFGGTPSGFTVQQTQSNTGLFGNQASTQQNAFGAANTQQQVANQASTQAQASSSSGNSKLSIYTPLDQLTAAEKEQFSAPQFTLGKIPTRPPPQEFCH